MCKYKLYILLALLGICMPLEAKQPASEFSHGRHSIRLGCGLASERLIDKYLDVSTIIHPCDPIDLLQVIQGMPAPEAHQYLMSYRRRKHNDYTTTGSFFLSYNYHFTPLLSAGAEINLYHAAERYSILNGYNTLLKSNLKRNLFQLSVMPMLRATYYRHSVVELYSAIGIGYTYSNIANDSSHGLAFNFTLFGVNVGNEHWFAEAELGGISTLEFFWYGGCQYLYGARLFSVALGYRF